MNTNEVIKLEQNYKKVNLNSKIKVKLTPYGAEIYYYKVDGVNEKIIRNGGTPLDRKMPCIDKDGFTEFQLWEFINLYGSCIGLGRKEVLSDICLYISEKDLEDVSD
ncbi:MAG: hypothetical protein NC489_28940 [Ruminococcus flavefaciens]|nr:hypothetical protein [Ruminococcus flavefaciens]